MQFCFTIFLLSAQYPLPLHITQAYLSVGSITRHIVRNSLLLSRPILTHFTRNLIIRIATVFSADRQLNMSKHVGLYVLSQAAQQRRTVVRSNQNQQEKMENWTPCKIVTPENFILKLGTRDYVEDTTHYTNVHVHRISGGFSTNR